MSEDKEKKFYDKLSKMKEVSKIRDHNFSPKEQSQINCDKFIEKDAIAFFLKIKYGFASIYKNKKS